MHHADARYVASSVDWMHGILDESESDLDSTDSSLGKAELVSSQLSPLFSPLFHDKVRSNNDHTRVVAMPGKARRRRKLSLAEAMTMGPKLLRRDTSEVFAQNLERTLHGWISLLHVTHLPSHIPITSMNLSPAINALYTVISGNCQTGLPARFGYLQLLKFLESLEHRVPQEKLQRLLPCKIGRVNASIALDIFQATPNVAIRRSRKQISDLKRLGARWNCLVGPSALLLLVWSEFTETLV